MPLSQPQSERKIRLRKPEEAPPAVLQLQAADRLNLTPEIDCPTPVTDIKQQVGQLASRSRQAPIGRRIQRQRLIYAESLAQAAAMTKRKLRTRLETGRTEPDILTMPAF